jgi:hypothetical protein
MKKIILKYYLYVQVFKRKKKPGMEMVTKKKELLVNLFRILIKKCIGNVGAHKYVKLKLLEDQ